MKLTLSADLTAHPHRWSAAVDGRWLTDAPTETSASLTVADLDLGELDSARCVAVWFGDGETCTLSARRPRGAKGQDRDTVEVQLPGSRAELSVFDPRLSTEYDATGQPRRFGVELWLGEDSEGEQHPWRIAGEAQPGTAGSSGSPTPGAGSADAASPATGSWSSAVDPPGELRTTAGSGAWKVSVIPMAAHASDASGLALYVLVTR
ncbi:MAG TPA: hypothetical protein VFN48_08300 [Solirubrobacteraceae bacterium]|nr:hypothetical protein [Solirubrobacteraceae bacterium]